MTQEHIEEHLFQEVFMPRLSWKYVPLGALLIFCLVACGTTDTGITNNATPTSVASTPTTASATCPAPNGDVHTYSIVSEKSEASYKVQEKFLNRDLPNEAVGRTNDITGNLTLTLGTSPVVNNLKITVDLTTLRSDENMRDERIRDNWLESNKYPHAIFEVTEPQPLPADYKNGKTVEFDLKGNLTIHNTTKPATFHVTGKLDGSTITGKATDTVMMKDFGITPPDIAGLLTVKDGVTLTFDFTAEEKSC
jgi:polyisoprenoid-binding protein YceI